MLSNHSLFFQTGKEPVPEVFSWLVFSSTTEIPALILKPSSCKKTPRHLARSFPHLILHSIQLQLQFQINSDSFIFSELHLPQPALLRLSVFLYQDQRTDES